MAITEQQEKLVKDVLDLAERKEHLLSNWDKGFIFGDEISKQKGFKSLKEKWDQYGPRMHLSDKQDELLRKMYDKLAD